MEWQQLFQEIAQTSGRQEAFVVRSALAQYLDRTDPGSIKGAIRDLQDRMANLERQQAGLGRLVG